MISEIATALTVAALVIKGSFPTLPIDTITNSSILAATSNIMNFGDVLTIDCPDGRIWSSKPSSRRIILNCRPSTGRVEPTRTPTPRPTQTIEPTTTPSPTQRPVTPTNTPTPTSSNNQGSSNQPTQSSLPVAICSDHDISRWHPLVKRNGDGSVNCTYGHEHHDDPSSLDNVFGPVGQYTNGQGISYPWQTSSLLGSENAAKHSAYKWNVVSVSTCKPSFAEYGFKSARGQFHQDAIPGALVRFHSYWFEGQVCDPADSAYSGIIRVGGHMDYGFLHLTDGQQESVVHLAGEPSSQTDDRRLHMGHANGKVPCCRNGDFTWYGSNRQFLPTDAAKLANWGKVRVRNGLRGEDWGALDRNNLSTIIFNPLLWYGSTFNGNNSWQEPIHLMSINVPSDLDSRDGTTDGRVNLKVSTDRNGNLLKDACSPSGPDCVPLVLENVKPGNYQFRADNNGVGTKDYDVQVGGKSLIQYPN